MANKKLGKGLSSLLGNKEIGLNKEPDNKGLLLVPIEKIYRDEFQPRKDFVPITLKRKIIGPLNK